MLLTLIGIFCIGLTTDTTTDTAIAYYQTRPTTTASSVFEYKATRRNEHRHTQVCVLAWLFLPNHKTKS